ncbi:MAG TPA: 50S ribosomal protein L29 [Candidatus Paceibacterota bacterium]|nr:50S ribosomal protein L29 [Candidatus Paceibacterota bacterium]HMO82685.1 50S ribosomal protein L29 [Candidatus Paceibacterota bacterium]
MTKMSEIRDKSEAELTELVNTSRETIRAERFKDKFSRKASIITGAKREIARALTVLRARRRNPDAK